MQTDEVTKSSRNDGNTLLPAVFRPNDKIIWDSGFGYEIGYFLSENGVMYNTYSVEIITGICTGEVSNSINEIKPYSKELIKELSKRYGYEKDWSDVF